jgi:hypothetical protein
VFIYDDSASVQERDTTRQALLEIPGVVDVVIVSRPSQLIPKIAASPATPRSPKKQDTARASGPGGPGRGRVLESLDSGQPLPDPNEAVSARGNEGAPRTRHPMGSQFTNVTTGQLA